LLSSPLVLESFCAHTVPWERTLPLDPSNLLPWIYGLMIGAAVCFLSGVIARFIRHKEGTLWYRGTLALLAFAMTLLLLAIYFTLANSR